MKFAVYSTITGQILRTIVCSEEQALASIGPDEAVISSEVRDDTHYIVDGVPVVFPPSPSGDHRFDFVLKQWRDPRTLTDLQAAKWSEIKRARDVEEESGFPYLGKVFDSDPRSVQRISVAAQAAARDPAFSVVWKTKDNSYIALDAAQMQGAPAALAAFASSLHTHAAELLAQIQAAQTPEEIAAIQW